jgi:hypothetical protein
MNFRFAEQIIPALTVLDFENALSIAETGLGKLPQTEFHAILGTSLVSQAVGLVDWIDKFYQTASKNLSIKALYFEMVEFDINTEHWYIDGFAYTADGSLSMEEMNWLSDWQADTRDELGTVFLIEGLEPLQKAFAEVALKTPALQDARDWCEQIVITRFMELMHAAHLLAKNHAVGLSGIPWYFTEHSYDFIVRSEGKVR